MKFFKSNRKKKATNESLNELFRNIKLIQIKSDGVNEDTALSDYILLKITKPLEIQEFQKLIAIEEPQEDFHCMCLGDYAIELISDNKLKSTIGFHHGVSIRYNKWTGDAELKYSDKLLEFLSDLGLKKPLEQKQLDYQRAKESKEESNNWLKNSPFIFSKYWNEINDFDDSYLPRLLADLKKEYPTEESLIIALLKSFGTSENLWSGYPIYESISQKILDDYEFQNIINAYTKVNKEKLIDIGLGRYLFSWDFRKRLNKYSKNLDSNLLDNLKLSFESINDEKGIKSIEKIKNS